jgi:hypothetical protein
MKVLPLFEELDKALHAICDVALKAGGVAIFAEVAKIANSFVDHKELQDPEVESDCVEEEKAS